MKSVEQLLEQNGFYAAAIHGISMLPLLTDHRDIAFIEPSDTIRRFDVVLFRRDNGQLVLHRVLRCDATSAIYAVAGDNDSTVERVRRDQILGVMTSFCRDGKTVRADSPLHRWYARFWNATPLTRSWLQRLFRRLRRRR
ncbi:MAG: S24/S26 family peptidase [Clostridia bacterium]|nr:S24/S26 family peptidase [Clostridia bacterium]